MDSNDTVEGWNLGGIEGVLDGEKVKETPHVHTLMNAFIGSIEDHHLNIRPHDNTAILDDQKPDHLVLATTVSQGRPSPMVIRSIFDDKGPEENIGNKEIAQAYKYARKLLTLDKARAFVIVALMSLKECIVLRFKRGEEKIE